MLKKVPFITGFTLFAILLIWLIWQTVYPDIPRGGPLHISGQLLVLSGLLTVSMWLYLRSRPKTPLQMSHRTEFQVWAWLILILILIQVFWGGITSGLHGGHVYNTFPKMNQNWIPPEILIMEPVRLNFIENAATAQWMHRVFGTVLGVLIVITWVRSFVAETPFTTKKWLLAIFALFLVQYALGVFALIYHVPPLMGLSHLLLSFLLIAVSTRLLYHVQSKRS
ncbi:hypothetical protein DYD21_02590 [Rhodohalobacter sp. SW132]|uniref:COX15/CtaA family protein n=1 Tax=Rhodohalobacter sp. SW132 TaxID=2293433 RepID=UPI000E27913C|nr:COX15/CtaA family protein [Rhodohalobacter sp. SW132]REL38858.1 hypothetical protein DYD21_02590 [Rhodohalobacter sp. SW132]